MAFIALTACSEDGIALSEPLPEAVAPVQAAATLGDDVFVRDGMLVFADEAVFERIFGELQNYDRDRANEWERRLGFVSQRQIFDQIVDAEYEHLLAPYEGMSDDELSKIDPPVGHSDLYNRYLEMGLIREVRAEDSLTYDYNLPNPSLARVINEQGFVAIGDKVYQMKSGSTDGLSGATPPVWKPMGGFSKTHGWVTIGSRRGFMQVWMNPIYYNPFPYTKVQITYNVNVKSQKKNFWGNWVYASCPNEVWIWSNWTLALDYRWKTTLGFAYTDFYSRSYSYPYHPNCINNFYGSFNPLSAGTIPYPGTTTITITNPNLAFYDVRISPMNWQAAVPGGSSGIYLQVTN